MLDYLFIYTFYLVSCKKKWPYLGPGKEYINQIQHWKKVIDLHADKDWLFWFSVTLKLSRYLDRKDCFERSPKKILTTLNLTVRQEIVRNTNTPILV